MREFTIKTVPKVLLEAKSNDRIICGYWSVFGNIDKQGDIMQKGCFSKTLQENPRGFKYCFNHNLYDGVIGKSILAREDDKGLYVEAKVSETPLGDYVLALTKDGVLDKHSIGFIVIKSSDEGKHRVIQEVRLFEGSILSVEAANDKTTVEAIKQKYFFFGDIEPRSKHFYPPKIPIDFFSNLKNPFKN